MSLSAEYYARVRSSFKLMGKLKQVTANDFLIVIFVALNTPPPWLFLTSSLVQMMTSYASHEVTPQNS